MALPAAAGCDVQSHFSMPFTCQSVSVCHGVKSHNKTYPSARFFACCHEIFGDRQTWRDHPPLLLPCIVLSPICKSLEPTGSVTISHGFCSTSIYMYIYIYIINRLQLTIIEKVSKLNFRQYGEMEMAQSGRNSDVGKSEGRR